MAAKANVRFKVDKRAMAKLRGASEKVLQAVAEEIVKESKILSPFMFGTNRRSIDVDAPDTDQQPFGVGRSKERRRIAGKSGYSAFLELGTRKMRARPYMRPALTMVLGRIKGIIGRVKRGIGG